MHRSVLQLQPARPPTPHRADPPTPASADMPRNTNTTDGVHPPHTHTNPPTHQVQQPVPPRRPATRPTRHSPTPAQRCRTATATSTRCATCSTCCRTTTPSGADARPACRALRAGGEGWNEGKGCCRRPAAEPLPRAVRPPACGALLHKAGLRPLVGKAGEGDEGGGGGRGRGGGAPPPHRFHRAVPAAPPAAPPAHLGPCRLFEGSILKP